MAQKKLARTTSPKKNASNATAYLPKGDRVQLLLKERAKILATPMTTKDEDNRQLNKYIRFRLGMHEQYGIPYEFATEVLSHVHVTPVPCADFFIIGTMNYRGLLIAVLDLEKLFYKKSTNNIPLNDMFIIIIQYRNISMGITTNYIYGSESFNKQKLDAPLPTSSILKTDYILGIHQGQTAIINIPSILTDNLLIKTTS